MKRHLFFALMVGTLLWSPLARGQTYDPDTLHIGTGFGNTGDTGLGSDPNVITSTDLSIYQTSQGAATLSDPLILILGIPYVSGAVPTAPTLGTITYYAGNTTPGVVGTATQITPLPNQSASANGILTSTDTSGAYTQAGFLGGGAEDNGGTASENWTNWASADATLVPGVTAFYLFAYELSGFNLAGGDLVDVRITSGLPVGSYAIAYGCQPSDAPGDAADGSCAATSGPDPFATPFTQAGQVNGGTVTTVRTTETTTTTAVPEPATLALLGSGLGVVAQTIRRRKKRQPTA